MNLTSLSQRLSAIAFAVAVLFLLASCETPDEQRRRELREDARGSGFEQRSVQERVAHNMKVLDTDPSPTMRWQAAQNLGDLGDAAAYDLLVKRGLERLADNQASVRRECIIALGKLKYSGAADERRLSIITRVRDRLVFPEPGASETDHACRMALVGTLTSMGTADGGVVMLECARALREIAAFAYARRETGEGSLAIGLMENALDALITVTRIPKEETRLARKSQSDEQFISEWWPNKLNNIRSPGTQ